MKSDKASWLHVERRPRETLRAALERRLREAIGTGALRAGTRLPSSRGLAARLGVSRGVVTEAYARLAAQGFLETPRKSVPRVVAAGQPQAPAPVQAAQPARPRYDFSAGTPDAGLFPSSRWLAALRAVVASASPAAFDYGEPRGEAVLRETLADYLGRTRGATVDPAQVVVVQGAAQGLDLLARVLAARGAQVVAVEDPGLPSQWRQFAGHGLTVAPQPVDGEGLVVEGLRGDAVLVTPAHQFPTGAVLSAERRRALLGWADRRGALVIEDDYDAEFRYDQVAVRALQGLAPGLVAYVGTVSKTLAPALRLGWVVVPPQLSGEASRIKEMLDAGSPALDQRALAAMMRSGDYERHLRRARGVYRRRHDELLRALRASLPGLPVQGVAAGLHLLLRLPRTADDAMVARACEGAAIRVSPVSAFARGDVGAGLVLGYGRLTEEAASAAVQALASVLAGVGLDVGA